MSLMSWVGLILAVVLGVYLFIALLGEVPMKALGIFQPSSTSRLPSC
jgi:hypothetical protein